MTDLLSLSALKTAALVVGCVVVALWVDEWVEPEPSDTVPVIQEVNEPLTPDDLPEPTTPQVITKYEAPDSQDTRTDCVTLPSWIPELQNDSTGTRGDRTSPDSSRERTTDLPESTVGLTGLPYVITPMTGGSPSLSVGPRQVTLSSIDPRTGAGVQFEYDVPTPTWALTARGSAIIGRRVAVGASAIQVEHRSDWGTLGIGPAALGVVTSKGYEAGLGVSLSIRKTLWSK